MKPSSLKLINSKVEKTKGHEYFDTKNRNQNDEGSPTRHEQGLCEGGNKKCPKIIKLKT